MIDSKGYRSNVGIIIINQDAKVFWGKRVNQDAWQFPQGGVDENEPVLDALFRELYEEVGLKKEQVSVLGHTRQWLRYKLPKKLQRNSLPLVVGQKQRWYLLKLKDEEAEFKFDLFKPEFDSYEWVNFWYPVEQVIHFKKDVYRRALRELAPFAFETMLKNGRVTPLNRIDMPTKLIK